MQPDYDAQKVLDKVLDLHAKKMEYALSSGAGMGDPAALPRWEESGFNSPEAFLMAKDTQFQMLVEILKAGE